MDRCERVNETFRDLESRNDKVDLDDFEEFMRKVEEVNKMVHALASGDKAQVEDATKSADSWLERQKSEKRDRKETFEEIINNPNQSAKSKKKSKSVINYKESGDQKLPESLDNLNSESMSQEDFMRSVEEDAKKRSEDRKKRIIESDAIKLVANKAFREKDFEKALDLYNKAIDVRKDSCVLYTNRALTLLNLELYTRALKDTETSLRLNESSFKARLYQWHAYYKMGDYKNAKDCLEEIKSKFPNQLDEIEDYEKRLLADDDDDCDET